MSWTELSLPVGVLAPMLFVVGTSGLAAVIYPLAIRRRLRRLEPSRRASFLLLFALAPLAAACGLTLLAFAPSLLGLVWPALDHCTRETAAAHPHLCIVHPPSADISLLGFLLFGAVLGGLVVVGFQRVGRLMIASQVITRLTHASKPEASLGAHVVDSVVPFAFTGGAIDVRMFLSKALVASLSAPQLDIVVAHERHHLQGRHPLWRSVLGAAACLHTPWVRRAVVADFELATEQACDEAAAIVAGSRPLVAKTILDVNRLAATSRAGTVAFGVDHVSERVEALLSDTPWSHGLRVSRAAWWALGLLALLLSEPLHHVAETILGLFV